MSNIEICWFWGWLPVIFVGFVIVMVIPGDTDWRFPPLIFLFLLYFMLGVWLENMYEPVETLKHEEIVKVVHSEMVEGKLFIVTDKAESVEFTSFKDVSDFQAGKPVYRRIYNRKDEFGPDFDNVIRHEIS